MSLRSICFCVVAVVSHGGGHRGDCLADEQQFAAVPASSRFTFRARRSEATVPEPYRLKEGEYPASAKVTATEATHRVLNVTFPSPVQSPIDCNNTVHAEYFQPQGEGPFPGVIVLHILGGEFRLSQTVAEHLAKQRIAALFIKLPYYGERRDPRNPRRMLSENLQHTLEGWQQAVKDIRVGLSWLEQRPEVDGRRLGITGISLGGIVSGVAGACDERFRYVTMHLAGGNLPATLWDLRNPEITRLQNAWKSQGITRAGFIKMMAPIDPVTYAKRLANRKVLLVAGRFDEVIPPDCARALHQAIGPRAHLVWLNAGHYSAALFLHAELKRLEGFFTERWPPSEKDPR